MSNRRAFCRRHFLGAAGALGAAALLPRSAYSATPAVRRVIIVTALGGLRWSATFDGQNDPHSNPWGLLPWNIAQGAVKPSWGFSRMLVQRPLPMNASGWNSVVLPHLISNDPGDYNVLSPTLSAAWNNGVLPSFVDLAADVALVRATADPDGPFDGDHQSAALTLMTSYRSGQIGLVTAMQHMLEKQLEGDFATRFPLPSVNFGPSAFPLSYYAKWGAGSGEYAHSRPLTLRADKLPTVDPGASVSAWGRKLEDDLGESFRARQGGYMEQVVADFLNDKSGADQHVGKLVDPALHLLTADPLSELGVLLDGTPVTNAMLGEVFGLTSDLAPPGDILFDAIGALKSTPSNSVTWSENRWSLAGSLAVRLLQKGAPIVAMTQGGFDSHSGEVLDLSGGSPQTVSIVQLTRMLCGLSFALRAIADPLEPARSLWDTTVIVVCSEFGRGEFPNVAPNGFNTVDGSNGGGSGHWPWSGMLLLGGPVVAGGELCANPEGGSINYETVTGFYQQNRVVTTVLKAMGIAPENNEYLSYAEFPPIENLLAGV